MLEKARNLKKIKKYFSSSMPQAVSEISWWGWLPLASRGGCFLLDMWARDLFCSCGGRVVPMPVD